MVNHDWCINWLCMQVNTIFSSSHFPLPSSVISVKWVGLFATLLVGAYTIEDLWNKFGDLRLTYVCEGPIPS